MYDNVNPDNFNALLSVMVQREGVTRIVSRILKLVQSGEFEGDMHPIQLDIIESQLDRCVENIKHLIESK